MRISKYFFVLIFLLWPIVCQSNTNADIILDRHYLDIQIKKLAHYSEEDVVWLARNIYFEARSESLHGKMVVAFVTLNRVFDRRWPSSIKGVVRQKWQFSWYNKRIVPKIEESKEYTDARLIALMSIGLYKSMAEDGWKHNGPANGATHYFAVWLPSIPSWTKKMEFVGKVGEHLLYKSP